jgi:RNA polymerase sigma-70 factor (ECF subfamily)
MDVGDGALLQAWRAGDRRAGEALMARHYRSVLRYFELNASWSADDLAQKTFMACVEQAEAIRDPASFRSYLLGIARRQLLMHRRHLARTHAMRSFQRDEPEVQTKLSTLFGRNQLQLHLLRALASIPSAPQLLLILYYWEGSQPRELAEAFGIPGSTVRSRLQRARDALRTQLESMTRNGFPSTDDALEQLLARVAVNPDEQEPTR